MKWRSYVVSKVGNDSNGCRRRSGSNQVSLFDRPPYSSLFPGTFPPLHTGSFSRRTLRPFRTEVARVPVTDPSISFCPRESCQTATPKLDEDKLRICPSCQFAYCVFCRKGWHGTRNPCSLPQSNAIVSQYMAADESEKRTLEQRYGAANLKRLVTAFEEERALQEWLEQHATRCPGCSVPIEKSHGCNHVSFLC